MTTLASSETLEFKKNMDEQTIGQLESLLDALFLHFSWCVWHEGVKIYDDGYPGNIRDINTIRNDAIGVQGHNPSAQGMIKAASNNQLLSLIFQTKGRIHGEFQGVAHFRYAAYDQKNLDRFRTLLSMKKFTEIRSTYFNVHTANPNARNLLSGLSNADIEAIINGL